MVFEIAGFFAGLAGIGLALFVLYRRDHGRIVQGVYGRAGRGQRV
ncbi:hypothetical protein [Aestuariivirga sp.]|jgi:hypothetical protein